MPNSSIDEAASQTQDDVQSPRGHVSMSAAVAWCLVTAMGQTPEFTVLKTGEEGHINRRCRGGRTLEPSMVGMTSMWIKVVVSRE